MADAAASTGAVSLFVTTRWTPQPRSNHTRVAGPTRSHQIVSTSCSPGSSRPPRPSTTPAAPERSSHARLELTDCEVRNCFYAGLVVRHRAAQVSVECCRISGAAWHRVRYDDVSPIIQDNLIFGHALSGIYASADTVAQVRGNVFFAKEMDGMSCRYANRDAITGNTFHANLREAPAVLGGASP